MKTWMILLSAVTALVSVESFAADAAAGKAKTAMCAGCHMADGNSVNPDWPSLAGQHADYIAKQLADFKAGVRTDATMAPMVAALSEEDMADIAAYFEGQTAKGGEADPELVEAGKAMYVSGNASTGVAACAACHGPTGSGNPAAKFPSLQGQHAKYTAKQLRDFRSGARGNDAGKMMQDIAASMTDAEIEAVASYVQGLR
ncbi:c-type cytochrome [Solemya elarraichensis gill symbiont]|uniref:Cytochrome c4 n=1 Tax=Solemya elarraichensis gill symbiont TaxID=1918949 RepID=A0A1T2LBP9_9GAMM|nr:c-type cytochrome [Solemya elarraichensis gill symbiont]OOZ42538.1 cytochrome c4 [Solemya elarraichensis gill symbiont]